MLQSGIDRNTVVYDSIESLNLTQRLIYLMYGVSEDTLKTVFIPTDVFPEFDFAKPLYGIVFVRDKRLDMGGVVLKQWEDAGCEFPWRKESLVIGIERGGKILLGAT